MTYTLQNLGPYTGYSYDPRFRGNVIYAGQDRATGGRFDTHAAYWDGSWTVLPDPDSSIRRAVARDGITDLVVGHIDTPTPQLFGRAMIWEYVNNAWTATALPMPTGALGSAAVAVSDDGTAIAGEVNFGNFNTNAALWLKSSGAWTTEVLPQPDIRANSVGLNAAGTRVFGNILERPNYHPVSWSDPGGGWAYTPLQFPSGADPADVYGSVEAAQNGWAAGWLMIQGGPYSARRWKPDGTLEDLGTGPGTYATAIWNGNVVGVDDTTGDDRAFHWSQGGGVTGIHPADQDWSYPGDINAAGQIVGVAGKNSPAPAHLTTFLFLLTPQ